MKDTKLLVNGDTLRWIQFGLALGVAAVFGLSYWMVGSFHGEVDRAVAVLGSGDMERLRDYIQSFGNWAPVVSLALMVLQALVAPVPAFLITFANGLAFGFLWGGLLSVAGHALAATVCFWLARSLGRRPVELLAGRVGLESADGWIARRGALAVLLARLVPGISFDVVSYAVGLTSMGYGRFIAATVAGTLPQTLLYAYLGQEAPHYAWMLMVASGLVVAGAAGVTLVRRHRRRSAGASGQPSGERNPRPVQLRHMIPEQAGEGD